MKIQLWFRSFKLDWSIVEIFVEFHHCNSPSTKNRAQWGWCRGLLCVNLLEHGLWQFGRLWKGVEFSNALMIELSTCFSTVTYQRKSHFLKTEIKAKWTSISDLLTRNRYHKELELFWNVNGFLGSQASSSSTWITWQLIPNKSLQQNVKIRASNLLKRKILASTFERMKVCHLALWLQSTSTRRLWIYSTKLKD